ncbi:NTP transferase domain-containing protein [Glaciimonas sp. GS1]|uniref:NTP transferase domain-containing protein n=1 Tax=Glaciimonas soli TaxID=2590999 RepID=A0A843YR21_9BURK|nr:NTP transferase domain-containing protein [Glaciimonas soli]
MNRSHQIVGILLSAGRGRRFDASGTQNKLLQILPDGVSVLAKSAAILSSALPVCVVAREVVPEFISECVACEIVQCIAADQGMAASLVCGLQHAATAAGWVIALADMPFVKETTVQSLITALQQGADIAVPTYNGRRGNPVGFSRHHLARLLQLQGDQGARSLLREFPVVEVRVNDIGILLDIDTVSDLPQS